MTGINFNLSLTGDLSSFVRGHGLVIQLRQVWQYFQNVGSVICLLADGIILKPENFKILEVLKVLDLAQLINQVFAQIKLC